MCVALPRHAWRLKAWPEGEPWGSPRAKKRPGANPRAVLGCGRVENVRGTLNLRAPRSLARPHANPSVSSSEGALHDASTPHSAPSAKKTRETSTFFARDATRLSPPRPPSRFPRPIGRLAGARRPSVPHSLLLLLLHIARKLSGSQVCAGPAAAVPILVS